MVTKGKERETGSKEVGSLNLDYKTMVKEKDLPFRSSTS